MVHYNIAKKIEINPFENVKWIILSNQVPGISETILYKFLNKNASEVSTRKIGDSWRILYNIELMDFVTIINWLDVYRGTFKMSVKAKNSNYILSQTTHFRIEEDIMYCW